MISAGVGPTTGAGGAATGGIVCGVAFAEAGGVEAVAEPEISDFASLTAFLTSSQPKDVISRQDNNVENRHLR